MNYYLDLFTPFTWSALKENDGAVTGFTIGMKSRAEKVKPGDVLICYLIRLSRWCGALEVIEGPYIDSTPIFDPSNDKFVVRFRVKPLVLLDAEYAVPIGELWTSLNRTKNLNRADRGWVYTAQLVSSLVVISPDDGKTLVDRLNTQFEEQRYFQLDAAGKRALLQQPVRTPKGAVEVIVPGSDDVSEDEADSTEPTTPVKETRDSIVTQAALATIGAKMGYSIWVPRNDRAAVKSQMNAAQIGKLLEVLPLNYEDTTLRTVEQIDVIWLRGRSIVRAFEVEHTTAVYSGLLRMADLLSLQPNINIRLHIVADEGKREKVFREIKRPVFSLLENGALSASCSYLSYTSVAQISKISHLQHMTDSIIDDFHEEVE